MRWNLQSEPPASFFEEHPELPKPIGTILYHRGIRTAEQIDEYLHPDYTQDIHDPFLFQHMDKAVDRLLLAMEHAEPIVIYGDYDADGVSASVVLMNTLQALGGTKLDVYLPHREKDGYGLNMAAVEYLAEQGTKVIITCDCGISNKNEVARANELGMDVIITDHHSVPPELPEAFAIIHPKVDGEPYPDQTLSGGAVAFKLAQGLLRKHEKPDLLLPNGETHAGFEKWLLDMVAIANVADMVPLLGEARTLTTYGLLVLNKTRRLGLRRLLAHTRLTDENEQLTHPIDARSIGFHIAPRINAAGRIDHANVAYQLLMETDPEKAEALAVQLDENNDHRRELTDQFVAEAIAQVEAEEPRSIIGVFSESWNTGITGLVASRLKEQFQKPTIAMTTKGNEVTGSGRSVVGFSLIDALHTLSHFFSKFGGHPMACGFTLKDPAQRTEFLSALEKLVTEHAQTVDLSPTLHIDAPLSLDELDWELFDLLEKCRPFGQKNPQPTYLLEGLTIESLKAIGSDFGHLKLVLSSTTGKRITALGWGFCSEDRHDGGDTNWCEALKEGELVDVVAHVEVNEWNGNRSLQLQLKDIKQHS